MATLRIAQQRNISQSFTNNLFIHWPALALRQIFPELLKASNYVTTDAEEADYFFADGELVLGPRIRFTARLLQKNASATLRHYSMSLASLASTQHRAPAR